MAKAWNIKDHFEDQHIKKVKQLFDETRRNKFPASTKKRFRVNVCSGYD